MNQWDDMLDQQEELEARMQGYLSDQLSQGVWVSAKGTHIPIKQMDYCYLINCRNMIDRMGEEGSRWLYKKAIAKELRRRSRIANSAEVPANLSNPQKT